MSAPATTLDLSTYSAEALVDAVIRLTHEVRFEKDQSKRSELRHQRRLVKAELIRRAS